MLSILNGPAVRPGLQLLAPSHTGPEAIKTLPPLALVLRVNEDRDGSARPAAASPAAKPAVCTPRHQPPEPGIEQPSAAGLRVTDGATRSSRTVVLVEAALPALSVAVQETVVTP